MSSKRLIQPSNKDQTNYVYANSNIKPTIFEHAASNYPNASNDVSDDEIEIAVYDQDNVNKLYDNPALPFHTIPAATTMSESRAKWGMPRLCLFLFPAFSVEFCRVFAAMFIVLQDAMHFNNSKEHLLPLFCGGLIGLSLTLLTVRIFHHDHGNLTKRKAMTYSFIYHVVLLFAASLVVGPSWSDVSIRDHQPESPTNSSNSMDYGPSDADGKHASSQSMHEIRSLPLVNRLIIITGFTLLSSMTGSGQYFILCLATHVVPTTSQKSMTTVTVVLTAVGACVAGFVGAIDMASNWCPAHICPFHMIAQAAVISSGSLCLLVIGLVCSFMAVYRDAIAHACRPLIDLLHCQGEEVPVNWTGSRASRTAQEIFDECAALLRDHESSFSSSLIVANDNSGVPMDAGEPTLPTDATIRQYPHQISASLQAPNLRKMLRNKTFVVAVVNLFLLSCSSTTFQFYSAQYLSQVVQVFNATGSKVQRPSHGIDLAHWEAPLDVRDVFGLKMNGLAFFLCNGAFVVLYLNRKALPALVKPEWKAWAVPTTLLVIALVSCVTGALSSITVTVPFLLTACVISLAKLVEVVLLHTVVAQAVRTWPPVVAKLTDSASTLLWSLIPVSLLVSSAVQKLFDDVKDTSLPAMPMYLTGVYTLLAALTFSVFKINVI